MQRLALAIGSFVLLAVGAWLAVENDLLGFGAERDAASSAADGTARPLSGPPALAAEQLDAFTTDIERLLNGAAERVITRGSSADGAERGPLSAAPGRRVPDGEPLEREFELTVAGGTGSVEARGLAFTRPWPARYDMSLSLEEFSHEPGLTAQGAVQYNFVRDDSVAPPALHGLFRARLTLSGSYTGEVDLHGEVANGRIVALIVQSGRERFAFGGREPRPFVSYVSTVAGTGMQGNSDGPALEAAFNEPAGVSVDRNGRVFVADTGNNAVRELSPNGEVTTLSTAFDEPWDLGFDGLGLLVVSDRASSTKDQRGPISRVVTGGALKGTVIRTVGKPGNGPTGFSLCSQFSCDGRSPFAQMQHVRGIDVQGAMVTAAQWALPSGLRMLTPDGTVMTLRAWGQGGCDPRTPGGPHDVVWGERGELYFTSDCHVVWTLRPNGTLEPLAGTPTTALGFADGAGATAQFAYPAGLVSDGQYLYLTESSGSRLRRVEIATGTTTRIAGCLSHLEEFDCDDPFGFRDGPGDYAQFENPESLALDPWGDLYVADTDNHAIRFVRIANDPERRPLIERVQPLSLQQGAEATLTVTGRDLGLTQEVDLGEGLTATVVERNAKKLKVRVRVAEDAAPGAHALAIRTPFGGASTRDGMALNVIGQRASSSAVTTIAGTGNWSPGFDDIEPAELAEFAFPGGLAAIDRERLLVADPLEQRIRLITTKQGAARELLEIAAYQAGGQLGITILQGIEGFESFAGEMLGAFGLDNFTEAPRAELLGVIEAALDAICETAQSPCDYLALPWAGLAAAGGDSGGFRLGARLFLPTDIALAGNDKFLIADTGNSRVKTVGIDFSGPEPKDAPYEVFAADRLQEYPLGVVSTGADTVLAATATDATLAKLTLRDGSSVLSDFAGMRNDYRCERADGDVRHPLGVPMGMASGSSGTFIADPYCKTIWRVGDNGEAADIRGELKLELAPLPPCSDGPLVFATFSAPMDVAVDSAGNLWVADAGCHSIRVIKDLDVGSAAAALASSLGSWAGGIESWLESDTVASVAGMFEIPNLGTFDAARKWVLTVAGSANGEAGFRDGAAADALFNAPVSIAVAEEDDKTNVFVADAGNRRIRLIDMSVSAERLAQP